MTLSAHFDFTSFSAWPFYFLAATFFSQGVFAVIFSSLKSNSYCDRPFV